MQDWQYNELFEAVNSRYNNFLNEKKGCKYALARTSYEFETVCNDGKTESIIVHTALGQIIINHENVYIGYLDSIRRELSNFSPSEVADELTANEITDLTKNINHVLTALEGMQIDYNPRAHE